MVKTLVVKRDGREEPWNSDKVESAVFRALIATEGHTEVDADLIAEYVSGLVTLDLGALEKVSYDKVHDTVEKYLMDVSKAAAKNYIIYRKHHSDLRATKDALLEQLSQISKETTKDNGNVRNSPSAKIFQIGSAASNWFVDTTILTREAKEAHQSGAIHCHDKDFYNLTYNCIVVPVAETFKGGFRMPNGWINEPKRIISASSLVAVLIQSVQGQGGPLLA